MPLCHAAVILGVDLDDCGTGPLPLQERPLVAWLVAARNEAHAAIPDRRREFGHAIKSE